MKLKEFHGFVLKVLSQKNYFLTFLFSGLLIFFILWKFTLKTVANQEFGILVLMSGVNFVFVDMILLALISFMFGIFSALMFYKIKKVREVSKVGFLGSLGLVIGMFGAGCATCGAFLFSLLGMPLALMYFPFGGLELKALSVVWIYFSSFLMVKGMV